MRIVIFGGTGNIGTALLKALAGAEEHLISVVARRAPDTGNPQVSGRVRWHRADVGRDDLGPLVRGADVVVNLAWLVQPSHRPDITWSNNAVGAARLLAAVRRETVPAVVFASSVAAYSPTVGHQLVDESWPTHGASPDSYAREKAYVERLLDAFECDNAQTRVVRVRPAFVFQRSSASQQRRLFGGPLVPGSLIRPGVVPVLPFPAGLRFQAVHADDVGRGFASAVTHEVSGAFNLAADDALDGHVVADLLQARHLPVPARVVRGALAVGWRAHMLPSPPTLFDALLRLPVMSTTRARQELAWAPATTARDALGELLAGLRAGAGGETPPLDSHAGGAGRWREFATGIGQRVKPSASAKP